MALLSSGLQVFSASPFSNKQAAELKQQIQSTPAPELPAAAAKAVGHAKDGDKEGVVQTIISAVAQNRPTSLPTVVASIAAEASGEAAKAAAQAAKASPAQAETIVDAASKAAPGEASHIVQAVQSASSSAALDAPPTHAAEKRPPVTPGNLHGKRPTIPPGLVKRQYGSP